MPAKKKIKRGFYFRGHGNHGTIFKHEIYHWDGTMLLRLVSFIPYDLWADCSDSWGKDFANGSVTIGDHEQFTYLGE